MNWIINLLGGYTYKDHKSIVGRETLAMRIDCLQNERNRLTYLLSESKHGRIVDKISNELTNVTNMLLIAEK